MVSHFWDASEICIQLYECSSLTVCLGGGLWQPEAAALSKLRNEFDRKPHKIKTVLTGAGIQAFLGKGAVDEKKAVKAFVNQSSNRSTALKSHPKVSNTAFSTNI
jgi:hypothetical protein